MKLGLSKFVGRLTNRLRFGSTKRLYCKRADLAARFIRSCGIEIGALQNPLELPPHVKVRYVDRFDTHELRRRYPELQDQEIVHVDIIDDGETLKSIADASVDFVICNHLLEHCQNPIGAIKNWLRVIREGGILFVSVPDKRFTFDRDRPVTDLEHIIRDWREGPRWSRMQHYAEWAGLVERIPESSVLDRASKLTRLNYSIHFHVWTDREFGDLLHYCASELDLAFEMHVFQRNGIEIVAILERKF